MSAQVYSTKTRGDPLNADIPSHVKVDTKDICRRISVEMKKRNISQKHFAERILCRSQGTLSDLFRNPKPWNMLKSGKKPFRRMYNWIEQPLDKRMAIFEEEEKKEEDAPAALTQKRRKEYDEPKKEVPKRAKGVFSKTQKAVLKRLFEKTQRPSKEMVVTIHQHLGLQVSTIENFFQNARRRAKNQGEVEREEENHLVEDGDEKEEESDDSNYE